MNYLNSQLARLKPTTYVASIVLHDGNGNRTNTLNITIAQLEAIKAILKEGE